PGSGLATRVCCSAVSRKRLSALLPATSAFFWGEHVGHGGFGCGGCGLGRFCGAAFPGGVRQWHVEPSQGAGRIPVVRDAHRGAPVWLLPGCRHLSLQLLPQRLYLRRRQLHPRRSVRTPRGCPRHPVCLRIQINPQNKGEFQGISPERAFADFLFANTILHLVVINFVG
uniref:Dolichyl-diphosphooligosaccharide--protein glycosyltransferase subunit DAD1 n=1 Tax=Gallus gallus TaxID=9031 RepID=A0A8V0ZNQ4_CHICK